MSFPATYFKKGFGEFINFVNLTYMFLGRYRFSGKHFYVRHCFAKKHEKRIALVLNFIKYLINSEIHPKN